MSASTSLPFSSAARLRLVTFGDAALYAAPPDGPPERVLDVGKPLALLIYLACSRGREASRDHLSELLWAHMERDRAQNALRQTIWQLKSRLGNDLLSATRERISLIEPIDVDRDAFLAASEAGDIEKVVELYTGDFVLAFAAPGGAEFEQWADLERLTLRRIFVRSAEEVVQRRLTGGRARDALALARRAREVDRSNQRAWRLVLQCLIAGGDSVGAHVEADELAHLLAADEIDPDTATHAAIRRARATPNGSGAGTPADSASGLVADLIGREREFAIVMRAWDEVTRGQAKHFHITAPAGLGKTRFLMDVQNRLRAAGARTVYVSADFGTRDVAYSFASDVALPLANLRGAGGISPRSAGALVSLNPSLSSVFGAPPDTAVDDEALRHRQLALRELASVVADERPVAILLDDLHWSDALSFRALEGGLGAIERSQLLIVSASRPAANTRPPGRATPIALAPLNEDSVATLVSSLGDLPAEPWAAELPHALWTATGGSPLLVVETLQLFLERSLLARSDDGWTSGDPDALFEALAQGSALRRRVESLNQRDAWVLLLLAVSGVPLNQEVLAEAVVRSGDGVAGSVSVLEQRGLVLRRGDILAVAHDEHSTAVIDAADPETVNRAAAAVGRALLTQVESDSPMLCVAASLLARGGDAQFAALSTAFERFVRSSRLAGDGRSNRALARALLGPSATASLESALARSLPWFVRARLVSRTRIAATIGAIAVGSFVAGGAWGAFARPVPPPDAILVAQRQSADHATVESFRLPLSRWVGVSAIDVRVSGRPQWRTKVVTGVGGGDPRPDGRGWTVGAAVPDTGVLDIFELGLDGTAKRITFERLDDYEPTWAPDNSRFVFITSRWNHHGQYDLAIYETRSGHVRQITAGVDTDIRPTWSPDGSRIAFVRQYADDGRQALCVIDSDGSNLRCLPPEAKPDLSVIRWSDAHRVLLRRGVGSAREFWRFDLETGVTDLVDNRGADALVSPDGRYAVCQCPRQGYPKSTWIAYPVERPNEFATLRIIGTDPKAIAFDWAPTTPRLPFVARLSIDLGVGPPMLGASYQLRASGVDTAGHIVGLGVVRWRSEDTTVATIDSTGRLTPRRAGPVTIYASAGGWRDVRRLITIRDPIQRVLLDEDWTHGLAPVWRPFGVPNPLIVPSEMFGHAFLNNGDGSFFSGAYTTHAFDTRDGLWVEASVSTPVTGSESQAQVFHLFNIVDSVGWAMWDHATGDGPPGVTSPGWGYRYPAGIGGRHFGEQFQISAPSEGPLISAPPALRAGRAVRFVMQIFPDGSCGLALDGTPLWRGRAEFLEPRVHLMLAGNSVDAKMLVGRLRIGTGLAPNTPWIVPQ